MPTNPRGVRSGLPPLPQPGDLFVGAEVTHNDESPAWGIEALHVGDADDVLTVVDGAPAWSPPSAESGSATQVFEVTDLLIPAGTFWSGDDVNVIHTFDVEPGVNGVLIALDLAVAWQPPAEGVTDIVQFYVRDVGASLLLGVTGTDDTDNAYSTAGELDEVVRFSRVTTRGRRAIGGTQREVVLEVTDSTYGAPTEADLTVVYARAAFLVI